MGLGWVTFISLPPPKPGGMILKFYLMVMVIGSTSRGSPGHLVVVIYFLPRTQTKMLGYKTNYDPPYLNSFWTFRLTLWMLHGNSGNKTWQHPFSRNLSLMVMVIPNWKSPILCAQWVVPYAEILVQDKYWAIFFLLPVLTYAPETFLRQAYAPRTI